MPLAKKRTSQSGSRKRTKKSKRAYSPKASRKVGKAMHEYKRGELKSGSGHKVTSRSQAIAIGLSEAREEGAKVPRKRHRNTAS